jgi:ABC-type transport system substrate-binding protein
VGTGPYAFKSEVAGSSYSFSRWKGYWNNAASPRIANVSFDVFASDTALVTAIESGDVNVASGLQASDVSTLKGQSSLVTAVGPGTHFSMAYFNTNVAPFTGQNGQDLRIAFNMALNRTALMDAATDSTGEVQTEFALPGQPGFVKSLSPLFAYDPSKAAALVKQAGYANGVSLTCYEQPGQGYDVTGPIIVSEEAAVGINVNLLPGGPTVVAPFFTQNTQPCLLAQGSGNGDPLFAALGLWSQSYYNAGHLNFGADADFTQAYRTYKSSQTTQLFYNIENAFKSNPGYSVFYTGPFVNVYQKKVAGWIVSPLTLDNWQGLYYKS